MAKSKDNNFDKKRLLNSTLEILEAGKMIDDTKIPSEEKNKIIDSINGAFDKLINVLALSPIKGKGGVISTIKIYVDLLKKIKNRINADMPVQKKETEAKEFLAYRIQNKMCERLFPDDQTYIGGRIERIALQTRAIRPLIANRIADKRILDLLEQYKNIYIYEEDEESIILGSVLEDMGLKSIRAYISLGDAFRLEGRKIVSLEEAKIGEDDALIVASPKCVRTIDMEIIRDKGLQNVFELDVFDDNREADAVKQEQNEITEAEDKLKAILNELEGKHE